MDGGTIRIGKNFRKLLEDIINAKEEKDGIRMSYPEASEFVYHKIKKAGGIVL